MGAWKIILIVILGSVGIILLAIAGGIMMFEGPLDNKDKIIGVPASMVLLVVGVLVLGAAFYLAVVST